MKDVLSHEMNVICNSEDRFSMLSFFAKQVMLELQCT